MSRLYTGGAELGHAQADGLIVASTPTIDTAVKRTGTASFKATAVNQYHQRTFVGVLDQSYFFRSYFRFQTTPTGTSRPFAICTSAGGLIAILELVNGTNVLRLLNGSGVVQTTGTIALTAGVWYRIEISIDVPASGNTPIEVRIDGVTALSGSFALGNTAPGQFRFGVVGGNLGGIVSTNHDDVAINDEQGADQNSWPGEGAVYALLGVSDPGTGVATANWTKPGGATTNRHTSVGKPLVYQADSTVVGDAEKFVRNPTNATSQFEIEVSDYTSAGIPAGDKIVLVQPVAGTGSTSATDTAGSITCTSNPSFATKAMTTFDNGVASATVTTWPRADGNISYNPTVTRGTRPKVMLVKNAANRIVMCNMLALIVETKPPVTQYGASSLAVTFQASVAGDVVIPAETHYGSLEFPMSFGSVIAGQRKAFGQIAFPIIFSKEVQALRKTFGQLLSPFIFGKTVSGSKTTFAQVALPINIGMVTSGIRVGLTHYGVVDLPMIFGKDVSGQRKAFGQIVLPITLGKEVKAQRQTFSQIIFPITFTKEAVGRKNVFGQLSMQTLFGKEIAGRRKTFSQLAMPIIFSKTVVGSKQTFGKLDLPISVPIFVDGYGWVGPKTLYGEIAMPLTFGKQVEAKRKTFGQINAPLLFGSVSQGQRRTFGEFEFPIDFEADVKSGRVGVHGLIDLDLVLTIDTAGKIFIFGVILNDADAVYLGDQDIIAAYVGSEQVWPT